MKYAIAFFLATCTALAGDLTVDNLTVYGKQVVTQEEEVTSIPTNGLRVYYMFNTNTTPVPDDEEI